MTIREQLHRAIDEASNPGGCSYAGGCIVGKFFEANGFKVDPFDEGSAVSDLDHPFAEINHILSPLQQLWDNVQDGEAEETRAEAHQLVDTLLSKESSHVS